MVSVKNKFKKNLYSNLCLIVMGICLVVLGYFGHGAYDDYKMERTLNGLYIYNSDNISTVMEYAYSKEKKGDWVCINVAYDMSFEEAANTCRHECQHKAFSEIWAEMCEGSFEECTEELTKIQEGINNE